MNLESKQWDRNSGSKIIGTNIVGFILKSLWNEFEQREAGGKGEEKSGEGGGWREEEKLHLHLDVHFGDHQAK